MAKILRFKVKGNDGNIVEETYTVENTWILRNQELIRHEHYIHMANIAGIAPTDVVCDIQPIEANGMMACYRVIGPNINGQMNFAVGSASSGNVRMQGQYFPEMAFKRAYDSWVTSALGLESAGVASQSSVDSEYLDSEDIGQPDLVKVDFGKHRGKTLGEIWNESSSWITDWLVTDKFQPKNDAMMFLKKAGIALAQKQSGGTNQQQPAQQQPAQQQPTQQQSTQQQSTQQQPNQQQPTQQQPNQQQSNPVVDINVLKSELQNLWVTRGYDAVRAGGVINDFFKTNTINWQNITLEQVQQVLTNKDAIFVVSNNQQPIVQSSPIQQPPAQQKPTNFSSPQPQPVAFGGNQQSPAQQSQQPEVEEVMCDGSDPSNQHKLTVAEVDFCRQNTQHLSGKMYCKDCQEKLRKGNIQQSTF